MRLILKTKDGNFKTYWVTSNKNSILGWFSGDWLRKELKIPDDLHFDAHFTFPNDGNIHYSYKYQNNEYEEFINVYCDKVKIKRIIKGEKTLEEKSREEFDGTILGHLVPKYKPDTLDLVKVFHFASINFNIFNGSYKGVGKIHCFIEEKEIEDNDIVIDVSQMNNVALSISAAIQGNETTWAVTEPSKIYYKRSPLSNERHLELRCLINPLNNS